MATWFTSDTHFSHRNIINFRKNDKPLRDYPDYESMNENMIEIWNSRVQPEDTVYHLGDVAFALNELDSLKNVYRLNGKKILVMGNHDYSAANYIDAFDKVAGSIELNFGSGARSILTHIPVHTSQVEHRFKFNIHGHLHADQIDDPRYLCVSVEQFGMGPISKSDVKEIFIKRGLL